MQKIQNAEIQQRVINLVELYRTKVGKESQIAKDAKSFYEKWEELNNKEIKNDGLIYQYQDIENPDEMTWVSHLMVNEQLLGHFYKEIVGDKAEEEILDQLLPSEYDSTVYTKEEESFMKAHFKDIINYIILTPCDEDLKWVNRHDRRDALTIPSEVLELIGSRVKMSSGSKIYYPYAGFAQFVNLFKGCKFLFQNKNTWMQMSIFANEIDASFYGNEVMPTSYDNVVAYLYTIDDDCKNTNQLYEAYINMPSGGTFLLLCPSEILSNDSHQTFRDLLVEDKAIKEIIQLPKVMSTNAHSSYCIIIAQKDCKCDTITFIDASSAQKKSNKLNFEEEFDIDAFNNIINNDGVEEISGLRKAATVAYSGVDGRILVPYIYVIERPSESEHPVPLSYICKLVQDRIRDVKFDLPLDTPCIRHKDLSSIFKGVLDFGKLDKIGLPNNPSSLTIHDIEEDMVIPFVFLHGKDVSYEEQRIALYRSSLYLDDKRDAVLWLSDGDCIKTALFHPNGKCAAVGAKIFGMDLIHAFYPNPGIDAVSLLATLNLPIVTRQIEAYAPFGLNNHLDDILVPTNKRTVLDEIERLYKEQEAYKAQEEELAVMKTDYITEVRMRKHDMRPHLRQLASSEKLMMHYIDNTKDMESLKKNIRHELERSHTALTGLSNIVDHLSDEEKYGTPELLNIDNLLAAIEIEHDDSAGFAIEYDCDKETFRKQGFLIPNISEEWQIAKDKGLDIVKFIQAKSKEEIPLFINIAPVDFQRIVENIIENARKHGFTDTKRTDYYIGIDLTMDSKRDMYQIDFSNNGNPLPEGMDKNRFGVRGEKAGLTGESGNGGYIIKSIVSHYGGDYDIFTEKGITTIRIFLPIARI